jgi:hypothetical protein
MLAKRLWSESGLLDLQANGYILAKMVLLRGARCFAMFSSLTMLSMMTSAILFLSLKLINVLYFLSSKSVLIGAAYPRSVADRRLFLF